MIKDIATKEGAVIDLPDNFYSQIADMHSESKKEVVVDKTAVYTDRVRALPPTKKLYYDQPGDTEFEAMVIDFFDEYAVLDQTLFYPEGGGQTGRYRQSCRAGKYGTGRRCHKRRRSDPSSYQRRCPAAR